MTQAKNSKNGTLMKFSSRTDMGQKGFNQDALALPPQDYNQQKLGVCLVVADGISQCPKGGEIAQNAVKVVKEYYHMAEQTSPGENALNDALEKIWMDFFIKVAQDNDDDYLMSGTTLTLVLIFEGKLYLRHLGDSHCDIFYPDGSTNRITEEHNCVDGYLLNYFGGELQTSAQEETIDFPKGSKVVLSSDGINFFVEPLQMVQLAEEYGWGSEKMIDEMFKLSLESGSNDDKTVVMGY